MFVKDGNNPNKLFTQVHYLKGYFLLRWIGLTIGDEYNAVFLDYIIKHHGDMVTSRDFLKLVFSRFPRLETEGYTIDQVFAEWLDSPGLSSTLTNFEPSQENNLHRVVVTDVEKWEQRDRRNRQARRTKRTKFNHDHFHELSAVQLKLLLDSLIDIQSLSHKTLGQMDREYHLDKSNAEIQHRWFELVVKFRYVPAYKRLEDFLIHHQAMGVYLYGEISISRCPRLVTIAKKCYDTVQSQMEITTRNRLCLV